MQHRKTCEYPVADVISQANLFLVIFDQANLFSHIQVFSKILIGKYHLNSTFSRMPCNSR